MKLIKLFIAILVAALTQANAQSTQSNQSNGFQIELDPLAYIFRGYSVHALYQTPKFSYDLGTWALDIPKGFSENTGFDERASGFGGKINYHFSGVRGWYAGLALDYSTGRTTYKLTGQTETGHSIGTGLQLGYRFFFQKGETPKGFYVNPWVGVSYNFYTDKIEFANVSYNQTNITFFPTVHLGYKF